MLAYGFSADKINSRQRKRAMAFVAFALLAYLFKGAPRLTNRVEPTPVSLEFAYQTNRVHRSHTLGRRVPVLTSRTRDERSGETQSTSIRLRGVVFPTHRHMFFRLLYVSPRLWWADVRA